MKLRGDTQCIGSSVGDQNIFQLNVEMIIAADFFHQGVSQRFDPERVAVLIENGVGLCKMGFQRKGVLGGQKRIADVEFNQLLSLGGHLGAEFFKHRSGDTFRALRKSGKPRHCFPPGFSGV